MKTINKILIANRGEIALRIQRAARELGKKTVAIFSEPDRIAPHVKACDEAYLLEGVTLQETYLNVKKIIEIAKKSECDAMHPGYGFLSENPEFAESSINNGLEFIGPPVKAIQKMGGKTTAH